MNDAKIDWAEGQSLIGATDMQVAFAKALFEGANQTQAAKIAGYAGEGSTLRSCASQSAKSPKVRQLLAWAHQGGEAGVPDMIGDTDELMRILWRHLRGRDGNRAMQAAGHLLRLMEPTLSEDTRGPVEILQQIAETNPELAKALAEGDGMAWGEQQSEAA